MRLSSALSSYVLKTVRDGESSMSPGRLFQWLSVLTEKICFLYQNEPSPGATSPLSFPYGKERASNLFLTTTEVLENCAEVPTEPLPV